METGASAEDETMPGLPSSAPRCHRWQGRGRGAAASAPFPAERLFWQDERNRFWVPFLGKVILHLVHCSLRETSAFIHLCNFIL